MNGFWHSYGKRPFDIVFCAVVFFLMGWFILLVAASVRIMLGAPVLYKQRRLGQNATEFELYKFRSMTDERDRDGNLLPDEKRLTRFGKILRSTSLDELPQLLNILKGDMSLIGPRATLVSYKDEIERQYPERFLVPQGLTSLPAIRGRNALSWEDKFKMDVEYVQNFGFLQDMEIFFKTILVVLSRKGISMPGHATAASFSRKERG